MSTDREEDPPLRMMTAEDFVVWAAAILDEMAEQGEDIAEAEESLEALKQQLEDAGVEVKPHWEHTEGSFSAAFDQDVRQELEPGLYSINANPQVGIYFVKLPLRTEELLQFPDTPQNKVVEDISRFWDREDVFAKHELPYKRGILLFGPPGSGKSCTLQLIARDVIKRKGVILIFDDPDLFVRGYRLFRRIQPETPIVALMEDLDTILERKNESSVLNLLDGAEAAYKVTFLATTNYPSKLGQRITNRPSRFDRVYKVPHPGLESREMYLSSLVREGDDFDVAKAAKDTEGLSLAHLKELFVGVQILGDKYDEVLNVLRKMREKPDEAMDEEEFVPIYRGQYA